MILVLDFETYSEADLKKVGAYEYSKHPSTEILCASFQLIDLEPGEGIQSWSPFEDKLTETTSPAFGVLLAALRNPEVKIVAQNSFFEQNIVKHVFGPRYMRSKPELTTIPIDRWYCTAAASRARGLPGNLEDVCKALRLKHQKDKEGHRLMLKLSKPRKPSKNNPATRWDDPSEYARLREYCEADVRATVELFLRLPKLGKVEREFWHLDQEMNWRGFAVDKKLIWNVLPLLDYEKERLDRKTSHITKGKLNSVRQVGALLKWLWAENYFGLSDLRAQNVRDALQGEIKSENCRRLLEIRESLSRSSTAKYQAFKHRSVSDNRVRDNTIYYGAHTGRQSGTGLQPQNLFKTVLPQDEVELGVELIHRNDRETIEAVFPRPMDLYASAIRSTIVASPGHVLDVGDFATVEVRFLFWLAGHTKGLEGFAKGLDLYLEMAAYIYGSKAATIAEQIKAGDKTAYLWRQLGKQTVLGAGFGIGLGGEKFQATCKQYGINITLAIAQKAIRAYRDLHPPIPAFWRSLEKAVFLAMQNPGKKYRIGHLVWEREKGFLSCLLPIGRKLYYFNPKVERVKNPWGDTPRLSYMGIHSTTKQYVETHTWGGKLAENVVQACARDLLMDALLRLEKTGIYRPVLGVHDEAVCERKETEGSLEEFLKIMGKTPTWADGCPIKVEGWSERRYRK